MAATIKIKNSSTANAKPTSSDLVQGELAINVTDKKIFTEDSGGNIVELGANFNGFKNRIINGAMMIDQRNAGASVTGSTSDPYTTDRWKTPATQNSKFTFQQNAGSVTPPVGYINYLGATSSSAYAFGAGDYFTIQQNIEGLNTSDLGWGTASAATVTLSFWVRSSLTGAFGGSIVNSAQNRSYPFTYTISAANTWEQKTVTIAGDTSGTWLTTNGIGIRVSFSLGAGATYSGTAGAWAGSLYYGATGQVNVVGTSGATFYITGVQLEKGSTATSFDYRPYGTELALCQRYYEKSYNVDVAPGTGSSNPGCYEACTSTFSNNVVYTPQIGFRVSKRATPTMSFYTYSGTLGSWEYVRSGANGSQTATGDLIGMSGFSGRVDVGAAWVVAYVTGHWVASAEL